MDRSKVDLYLKIAIVIILFGVPLVLSIAIWSMPTTEISNLITGFSTINIILSLAEVMFLVRAVIFPKNGRKWWRE